MCVPRTEGSEIVDTDNCNSINSQNSNAFEIFHPKNYELCNDTVESSDELYLYFDNCKF